MRLARSVFVALSSVLVYTLAPAADYPAAPIRMVVGFPPGGGTDGAARIVSERLSEELGQPVVVENRAGAAGAIAAQAVARSPANGYTLFFGTGAELVINPVTRKVATYDVVKDFAAITEIGSVKFVMVVPASSSIDSVAALVAMATAKPGKLNFSSFGVGSTNHMLGELFLSNTGIKATHVPYQGSSQAMTALLAGEVDFAFETAAVVLPQIKAGKLKAIATPSRQRLKEWPNLPTLQEAGFKDLVAEGWMGVFAPAGTPAPVIDRLNQAIVKVVRKPDIENKLTERGVGVVLSSPDDFRRKLVAELDKWRKAAKLSGIALD